MKASSCDFRCCSVSPAVFINNVLAEAKAVRMLHPSSSPTTFEIAQTMLEEAGIELDNSELAIVEGGGLAR